ncbi:hypothetical protein MMC07_004393 [Pseudocyphellaria aurata]|nr:hypothetical protein [Pseudocyphellaria aurata]
MPSSFDLRGNGRASIPIAQLQPSISSNECTIVGQVALIWPYSSSKKSFGLLIVEPDFRLRHDRGQVHVKFSGSSAKDVARSGVKIGDEILLSLVGVEWTKDEASLQTPGHGIDWELCFRERLVLQLSRNSQALTLLDIDHPTPSPEPPVSSQIRSLLTDLAGTESPAGLGAGTQTWSSPAFLKRNKLPYAAYLNTQYDPFRDESLFENGGRRKKMRLGRKSFQWTFSNTSPCPDKESQHDGSKSSRSTSPDLVGAADDITSPIATPRRSSIGQKGALIEDDDHDKILPERSEDEAMVDELTSELFVENDPQASLDVIVNDRIVSKDDDPLGATNNKPPEGDSDGESAARQGPDIRELRAEPSKVDIRDEDKSPTSGADRPSTPTRRDSSIRQESPLDNVTHISPIRDLAGEGPAKDDLDRQEFRPEHSEVNIQHEEMSPISAADRPSTPTSRDLYIRQVSPVDDFTHISPIRDLVNEDPVTDELGGQDFRPESGEVNVQNEDSPPIMAEGRQSTPIRRDSSVRVESSLSEAAHNWLEGSSVGETPKTRSLNRQELPPESSEDKMQHEYATPVLANHRQSTPQDSPIIRDSPPNDATHSFLRRDSISESPNTQHLDRQELPLESSEDEMQYEEASQILAEDNQSSSIYKDSYEQQSSSNNVIHKSPDRDSDGDPSTARSLDKLELHREINHADMKDLEWTQIVPKGRQSSSFSGDSSTSQASLSNAARDEVREQTIDDDSLPEAGNDDQEIRTAAGKGNIEEELTSHILPEDRHGSTSIDFSSAHSPPEDGKLTSSRSFKPLQSKRRSSPSASSEPLATAYSATKASPRLKLSQPKRKLSASESSESPASSISMSQDSMAESQASVEDLSEDDSKSVGESISDSSEAVSTGSPLQFYPEDLEDLTYDQPSTGIESEDEVTYVDSGFNTPSENSPSSQVSYGSLEASGPPNVTAEDVPSDQPVLGFDGSTISLVRSTVGNLPLSSHNPEAISIEPENMSASIETTMDEMRMPKHKEATSDEEAYPDPPSTINADNIYPDDKIAKAKDDEERQKSRATTFNEDNTNENCRRSDSIDIEDESSRDQNMHSVSEEVNAAWNGPYSEIYVDTGTAKLTKSTSNASLDKNQEIEKCTSIKEEESDLRPDGSHSLEDDEPQLVQSKLTVDIIDLESEEEDNVAPSSPQVKEDPSQVLVGFGSIDNVVSKDRTIANQEFDGSRSEGLSEDHGGGSQANQDTVMTATTIQGSPKGLDSHIQPLSSRNMHSKDTSEHMETTMDYEFDSGVQHQDPGTSPQSSTSALEEAILGDDEFDPIFRSQLFTPISSQQRSLKSEPSIFSEKNLQLEHELPTPRLTQSTSAPPLPPTRPEPHKKPTLTGRKEAMQPVSAKEAHARKSIDYSKASGNWFTRKMPSQLTHVSDSEGEQESSPWSDQVSVGDEEPTGTKSSLEPSGPNISIDETPQIEDTISKSPPQIEPLETSGSDAPLNEAPQIENNISKSLQETKSLEPLGPNINIIETPQIEDVISKSPPGTKAPLKPSDTNIFTSEKLQIDNTSSNSPPIKGLRTAFEYYAPLLTLQSHFGNLISVLTILHSVDPIAQSKSGPRDFYRSLFLSDPSCRSYPPTTAQIFRPRQIALPIVRPGDAILLRNFKVQSFENRLGLLSTDSSAWAVFRKGVEVQVRGPPVEFGPEERCFIKGLWKWWESEGSASVEKAIVDAAEATAKEKARPVERSCEEEAVQYSRAEIDSERSRTPKSAKGRASGRTRSQVEYDMTPTPDSGRHELRDGTSYPDSTPERRARTRVRDVVHELRDGTTYTDTDLNADADGENKLEGRAKTKRTASAKPSPAVAEKKDERGVKKGAELKTVEHELRDGTRYRGNLK